MEAVHAPARVKEIDKGADNEAGNRGQTAGQTSEPTKANRSIHVDSGKER
jgi:hypothetical protein